MNASGDRTIAVALGGGGARGLAHIVVIEALDELGIKPAAIAGTSMGAIIGAAWAAGMSGRDIRAHVIGLTRDRGHLMAMLLRARVGRFADVLGGKFTNPVMVDAERLLDIFWPDIVPDRFEELQIPFTAVATDYYGRQAISLNSGPLGPAVAASMAIPGLVKPVVMDGRILFDGGMADPLPHRSLMNAGHFVIACDVTGGPVAKVTPVNSTSPKTTIIKSASKTPAAAMASEAPGAFEALLGASQIMQGAMIRESLQSAPPGLLLRPPVDQFRLLDFARVTQILAAAEGMKDEVKRAVGR